MKSQAHAIVFKRPMLQPDMFVLVSLFCFAVWAFYMWRLNRLGLERDKDTLANTPFWIKKLENICPGPASSSTR
jgi:hypothetical protein